MKKKAQTAKGIGKNPTGKGPFGRPPQGKK
jgi:hypothetical protein